MAACIWTSTGSNAGSSVDLRQLPRRTYTTWVDVNTQDEQGRTPLQLALKRGHQAIAEILCRYEADG
jgi:hypothetical protein